MTNLSNQISALSAAVHAGPDLSDAKLAAFNKLDEALHDAVPQPLAPQDDLVVKLHSIAWMLRRNLEDEDRRMALENADALISLIETGERPHDLSSARELYAHHKALLAEPRGTGGVPLVCKVGPHMTQAPIIAERDAALDDLAMIEPFMDELAPLTNSALRAKLAAVVSHATRGTCSDATLPLNDICCKITEQYNALYAKCEAKLAAAEARVEELRPYTADEIELFQRCFDRKLITIEDVMGTKTEALAKARAALATKDETP